MHNNNSNHVLAAVLGSFIAGVFLLAGILLTHYLSTGDINTYNNTTTYAPSNSTTSSGGNQSYSSSSGAPTTPEAAAAALHVDVSLVNRSIAGSDGRPAGWVYGQNNGVFNAYLPAGTCVDFDPRSGSIQGNVSWVDKNNAGDMGRAYMEGDGQAVNVYGLTVWWTSCQHL